VSKSATGIFILIYYLLLYIQLYIIKVNPAVYFLNVNQGDAAFILLSNEEGVLIDGGPDFSLENTIVGKYTYPWCLIRKIFISHFHADHTKGLPNIVSRCSKTINTFNDVEVSSYATKPISGLLLKNNFTEVSANLFKKEIQGSYKKILTNDNRTAYIYTLGPSEKSVNLPDENDRSLIQLIDIGSFEILFTGDASGEVIEKSLIPEILKLIDGRLEIYKVPHHGSKTGRSLKVLRMLKPVHCVVSVGRNKFGHPNEQVMADLTGVGCKVHRTDIEGDIEFKL